MSHHLFCVCSDKEKRRSNTRRQIQREPWSSTSPTAFFVIWNDEKEIGTFRWPFDTAKEKNFRSDQQRRSMSEVKSHAMMSSYFSSLKHTHTRRDKRSNIFLLGLTLSAYRLTYLLTTYHFDCLVSKEEEKEKCSMIKSASTSKRRVVMDSFWRCKSKAIGCKRHSV